MSQHLTRARLNRGVLGALLTMFVFAAVLLVPCIISLGDQQERKQTMQFRTIALATVFALFQLCYSLKPAAAMLPAATVPKTPARL